VNVNDYLSDAEMTDYELDEGDPKVQKLASVVRRLSQELLRLMMRELGRRYLGDENAPGLDIALWKAVVEVPVRLTDEEATQLELLSQQAGGWWRLTPEEEFCDLDYWGSVYKTAMKIDM
jgi:hypothetical protein